MVNETNKSLNKIREIINFAISLILFTNMMLLTLLILAGIQDACHMNFVIDLTHRR